MYYIFKVKNNKQGFLKERLRSYLVKVMMELWQG